MEEEQPYPDHPERFDCWQLLCNNSLTGRCYWEVEWEGDVQVVVTYRDVRGNGDMENCWFGKNEHSWSLLCSDSQYFVCHNNKQRFCPLPQSGSISHRVSVYVDCPAGMISLYMVSSDSLIHLYTFYTTFTEPLYAGFGFPSNALAGSSVCLCSV